MTLIIPHLLRYQGSAFVLDPKGENAKATGRRRAALNNTVHYLDPFGITGKPQARFNPLRASRPKTWKPKARPLPPRCSSWAKERRITGRRRSTACSPPSSSMSHVAPAIPERQKDLPTVRRMLLGAINDTLKAMRTIEDADGLLRDLARSFIDTPQKEFGSIVSTAQRQTEILDNPSIIACLSAAGPGEEVDFANGTGAP